MDINERVQAMVIEQDAEISTPPTGEADDATDVTTDGDTAILTQHNQAAIANFNQPPVPFTPQDHNAPQPGAPPSYTRMLRFIINQEDRARFVSQLRSVDNKMATAMGNLNATRAKIAAHNATWTQLNSTSTPSQVQMDFFHAAITGAAELGEFTARFIHPNANEETALKFAADFVELSKLTHKLMEHGISAMNLAYAKSIIVQNITGYVEAQRSTLYNGLEALQQSVAPSGLFRGTQ